MLQGGCTERSLRGKKKQYKITLVAAKIQHLRSTEGPNSPPKLSVMPGF